MWFVYIVECSDKTLYTGITNDLKRRIMEHNGKSIGAKYTKGRGPVELVYSFRKKDKSKAAIEECRIKKMPRIKKLELISKRNEKKF